MSRRSMHPFYLPLLTLGICEEGEPCLLWGAEKHPELRFLPDDQEISLDVRFRVDEGRQPMMILTFLSQKPLDDSKGQQWLDFRRALSEFFGEREEIQLAAWEGEECQVDVQSADLLAAGRLILETGQFIRGYLVGARLIIS